jgi:uncharacterized protein YjbJ (UPF0337 family)
MDWNAIEGNWKQVSASMKAKWGALTTEELEFVDRNKGALVAKVHDRTGLDRDTVERQLDAMIAGLVAPHPTVEKALDPVVRIPPSGAKPVGPG